MLYGSASPSEAFAGSQLEIAAVDLAGFIGHVAENAGVEGLGCSGVGQPVLVRADEFALEDVFAHLLRNAERYREPGTPILITLAVEADLARVTVSNQGPAIPAEMLERIFEYGVSDQAEAGAAGNRGQGLFVARTYMAKMGGTISARNSGDGVAFVLTLPCLPPAP